MNAPLEFFATDEAVAVLEAQLETATGPERVHALVAMAWQMRQRDTRRALALTHEAEKLLATADLSHPTQVRLGARLQLIRGEVKWLLGDLEAAKVLAANALQVFCEFSERTISMPADALGCADAHCLLAWLAADQGRGADRVAALQGMANAALGHDFVRFQIAQATSARNLAFRDVASAKVNFGAQTAQDYSALHPAAGAAMEDFWGVVGAL